MSFTGRKEGRHTCMMNSRDSCLFHIEMFEYIALCLLDIPITVISFHCKSIIKCKCIYVSVYIYICLEYIGVCIYMES